MEFRRILIRATNWVGDAVMCLPAMAAVRARFPEAHITLLARPWVAGLYDNSLVDDVIAYDLARGPRDLRAKRKLARDLQGMQFDCAILFQNAFEAAALVWMAQIPARIGYARDGRGLLLTDPIAVPGKDEIPEHQRFYYLELLRRAGLIERIPECEAIRVPGVEYLRVHGRKMLRDRGGSGDWIGVSPGAAYGTAKRWLPERFAEAAIDLARQCDSGVALFGSPDEKELCETVRGIVSSADVKTINFAGAAKLDEFVAMASACTAFLTNDSGAMHVASAVGVPTVAVFGATDHIATGPTGPLASIVREPVDCSPCLLRECPTDHRCMKAVESSRVAEEAWRLVQISQS
ncbi:MAG: lipopolysaccharide heptosyltransferase II [Acidobacteria bacterium]|nr:lipopolysaccharide heptosyltransferase II [Acidobacteriota bacterium]